MGSLLRLKDRIRLTMRLLTVALALCLCLVVVSSLESDRAKRPKPAKGKGKSKPKPKPKPPKGKGSGASGGKGSGTPGGKGTITPGGKGTGTPGGKGTGTPGGKGTGTPGGKGSGTPGGNGGKGPGMGSQWQQVWQLLQNLRQTLIALQQSGAGRPGGNGGGSGTPGGKGCEDLVCPEIYTPVCGADGKTYSNGCKACGVQVACDGECPCSGATSGPTGSTSKPVTGDGESEITVRQSWCQEPNGYDRRAIVRQPTTSTPGQKVPLVVCLHGNGGSANLAQWKELWDKNLIVAAEGYDRSWNIFKEASKAPDVEFINDLIAKVGAEYPNADMGNVVLVGYSNGAGMIHRLLVETPNPRPFHKVFPMASTLTQSQYSNGKFWKSSSVDCEDENKFDIEVTPASPGPEIYAIQGDNDGAIPYTGGPGVAGNTFLAAQDAVFLYAKTLFGYTGAQLGDSAGETTSVQDVLKYSYLNGKVNHYKVIGGTHGDTNKNIWPIVKAIVNPA